VGAAKDEPGVTPSPTADRACQQQCEALSYCKRSHPPVERRRPGSGDGTLLCPAQLPGALDSVAANDLIGINSDVDAGLLALFPDDGPHPFGDLTAQHLVAILGDPDDMEVDRKRCMGAMAIVTHAPQSTQNLLKLPPKGGGFAPPKRRQ